MPPMYTTFLVLHLLGMAVFAGVLLINARLKKAAETHGDPAVLRFAYLAIRKNDALAGGPGMGLLLVGGLGLAGLLKGNVAQPWFFVSMALMVPLFVGWMAIMLPAQIRLTKLEDPTSSARDALSRRWDLGWWITAASTLAVLVLMTGKNALI